MQTRGMKAVVFVVAVALGCACAESPIRSQISSQADSAVARSTATDVGADEAVISAVLDAQTAAWNAGDIDRFMQGYEDSPQTTFMGKTLRHGYAGILANYRKNYSSKQKMGTLVFSDIDVRMLCPANAVVTGRYKLTFPDTGAREKSGIFSLVWSKTAQGWKIVLDHTS